MRDRGQKLVRTLPERAILHSDEKPSGGSDQQTHQFAAPLAGLM
jgi:hypothetical protein